MIYFLIVLILFVALVFFLPIKFTIYADIKGKNVYYVENIKGKNKVIISLKILGVIPIYVYNKEKKDNKGKSSKVTLDKIYNSIKNSALEEEFKVTNFTKKILSWFKKVRFKKLVIAFGFNTEDYVKNSYVNATLNSIMCMTINANQDRINFNKLYYQVSISDYNYYLNLDTIITFSLFRNIDVFITIFKFISNLKKENNNVSKSNMNDTTIFKSLELGK